MSVKKLLLLVASVIPITAYGENAHLSFSERLPERVAQNQVPGTNIRLSSERSAGKTKIIAQTSQPIWSVLCEGYCDLEKTNEHGIFLLANFRNGSFYKIIVLDPQSGKVLWSKDLSSRYTYSTSFMAETPLSKQHLLGFQSDNAYEFYTFAGDLVARFLLAGNLSGPPVFHENHIFWRYRTGALVTTDLAGNVLWQWTLQADSPRDIGSAIESLIFPGKDLVVFNFNTVNGEGENYDLRVRVLNLNDGSLVTTFATANSILMDDERLYMQHDKGTLAAYDRTSFNLLWESENKDANRVNIVSVGKYLLSADLVLYLIEKDTGKLLDKADPKNFIPCSGMPGGNGRWSAWFWDLKEGSEPNTVEGRAMHVEGGFNGG